MQATSVFSIVFVLLWNSGFVGAEYGLRYTGPFTLLLWRYFILTLILFVYLFLRGRTRWPGWDKAAPALLVGALSHGVWQSCGMVSLYHDVPSGIVALVVALQPMVTGALSGQFIGERTPIHRWIGLLIGFCGVAITVGARIDFTNAESIFVYLIPFGSVMAMTAAGLIQRRLEVHHPSCRLPVDVALFYQSMATMLVLIIPAVCVERLETRWEPDLWIALLWLILGVSIGAYALMWRLIARMDATRVASLFYLGPPVTMMMAWAAFGDIISWMDAVGLAIVTAGVLLTQLPMPRFISIVPKTTSSAAASLPD